MNWKESSIPVKVRLDLSAASALILTSICNFSYLFFLNMENLISYLSPRFIHKLSHQNGCKRRGKNKYTADKNNARSVWWDKAPQIISLDTNHLTSPGLCLKRNSCQKCPSSQTCRAGSHRLLLSILTWFHGVLFHLVLSFHTIKYEAFVKFPDSTFKTPNTFSRGGKKKRKEKKEK